MLVGDHLESATKASREANEFSTMREVSKRCGPSTLSMLEVKHFMFRNMFWVLALSA